MNKKRGKKMENSYEYYQKVRTQFDAKQAYIGKLYY